MKGTAWREVSEKVVEAPGVEPGSGNDPPGLLRA